MLVVVLGCTLPCCATAAKDSFLPCLPGPYHSRTPAHATSPSQNATHKYSHVNFINTSCKGNPNWDSSGSFSCPFSRCQKGLSVAERDRDVHTSFQSVGLGIRNSTALHWTICCLLPKANRTHIPFHLSSKLSVPFNFDY